MRSVYFLLMLFVLLAIGLSLISCSPPWYKGWKPKVSCQVQNPNDIKDLKDNCIRQPELGIVKEF